jgi:hypothetical protein
MKSIVPIEYREILMKNIYMAQASIGLVDMSYIGALLKTFLHLSLIPKSHNSSSGNLLQRSINKHSSTCNFHCHRPQQALCLSVKSECYYILSPQPEVNQLTAHQLQGSANKLISSLLYVSHIPTTGNRSSACLLQTSVIEHISICKYHFLDPQQA